MRFMFIIHSASDMAPPPELMEAMHEMAAREVAAGRMIADGGLMPQAFGAALRTKGGRTVAVDGPFAETKEVIGGFAIFELPDLEAAIASGREFMDLHVKHMPAWEGVCEVRQIAGSQVELLKA
jgi:hypothetical protein